MKKERKTQEQIEAEKKEVEQMRARINDWLKSVPRSVVSGSYQTAVSWKQLVAKAKSASGRSRPNVVALRAVCSEITLYP